MNTIDYLNVLGLKNGASMDEVKAAFRKRAKETHPDLNPKIDRIQFQRVNESYTFLVKYYTPPARPKISSDDIFTSELRDTLWSFVNSINPSLHGVFRFIDEQKNKSANAIIHALVVGYGLTDREALEIWTKYMSADGKDSFKFQVIEEITYQLKLGKNQRWIIGHIMERFNLTQLNAYYYWDRYNEACR